VLIRHHLKVKFVEVIKGENTLVTKNSFKGLASEYDEDQYVFTFDSSKTLHKQAIYEDDNHYLLNVLKIYTNNTYFAVQYSCLNKESKKISHHFRCKDRGFSESLVDNKIFFIDFYKLHEANVSVYTEKFYEKLYEIKADFLNEYEVTFVFDSDNIYNYSYAYINGSCCRGLYGNTIPTETEILKNLIEPSKISLSNHITRINTSYSDIKVFHKTEV